MLNRIAIIFGVCLFFISSCKKDKEVYPIVLSTPSDFRLYAKPGDIVSISIKVTSEIQLRQFILKTQIVNELEIVELDSAINNKSFEYYFQYKVPETAAGRLIYLTYIAYDVDGNQGKNLQQIFVSDLTLKETAGLEFHSGFHFTNNAFDLETLLPATASLTDSTFRDLQSYITDSTIQDLPFYWKSPARGKFVRANNYNYALATLQTAESLYNASLPTDITDSLVVNDIYIMKLGSMVAKKYVVIKITGLVDQPGTDNDLYTFNVKK